MRVWIDQAYCTGSGLCELIEPRVFAIGDDGLARVRRGGDILPPGPENAADVPPGCEDEVRDASESCPGGCIRLEPHPLSRTHDIQPALSMRTIRRSALQTIAENLRCDQGRLNTGPQRINHFGTAARRQVMLMGASNTTMTQAVGRRAAVPHERPSLVTAAWPGVLLPAQRSRLFNLTACDTLRRGTP